MPNKNNGIWNDRVAVQKAFDRDPQHAYHVVASAINPAVAAVIEAALVPPPSKDEQIAALDAVRVVLEKNGLDTKAVLEKMAEIMAY